MKFPQDISYKLLSVSDDLFLILPEICLTIFFILLTLTDLFSKKGKNNQLLAAAIAGISLTSWFVYLQYLKTLEKSYYGFLNLIELDGIAVFFKGIFLLSGLLTILYSSIFDKYRKQNFGEFLSILFLIITGLHFLSMAINLLSIYLAVEMVSIGSYVITVFRFNKNGSEAGLKYFIFGAVSSAIMLYGMSLLYGMTGTLELNTGFYQLVQQISPTPAAIAVFLTICGFLFKIGAFPFHTWIPDIYQAAPTPVTAFFSVAPKAGGFIVLIRFIYPFVSTVFTLQQLIIPMAAVAIGTLAIGNFSALRQWNAKRLLAYSSIAHAGFIFLGFLTFSSLATLSVTYYISSYLIMNFAAFILVDMLSEQVGSEDVRKFAGLGVKFPLNGVIFVITLIALAGLPPTAGFYAKLFVFSALWDGYQSSQSGILLFLFIFGIFNALIALFYYLKIPYYMFFKTTEEKVFNKISVKSKILVSILAFLIIWIFFNPEWLISYLNSIQ